MNEIIVSQQAQLDLVRRRIPTYAIRAAFANPIVQVQAGDEFKLCGAAAGWRLWIVYRRDGDTIFVTRVRGEKL